MSSKVMRNVAMSVRLSALLTSIAPLVLFSIILVGIANDAFSTDTIGVTALPVIAVRPYPLTCLHFLFNHLSYINHGRRSTN